MLHQRKVGDDAFSPSRLESSPPRELQPVLFLGGPWRRLFLRRFFPRSISFEAHRHRSRGRIFPQDPMEFWLIGCGPVRAPPRTLRRRCLGAARAKATGRVSIKLSRD